MNHKQLYKVGQRVKIRENLVEYQRYYNEEATAWDTFIPSMRNNLGKETTIIAYSERTGKYTLEIDPLHNYMDTMFTAIPVDSYEALTSVINAVEKSERELQKAREEKPVVFNSEYLKDVEDVVAKSLKVTSERLIKEEIDKALDAGDKDRFNELVEKLKEIQAQ